MDLLCFVDLFFRFIDSLDTLLFIFFSLHFLLFLTFVTPKERWIGFSGKTTPQALPLIVLSE